MILDFDSFVSIQISHITIDIFKSRLITEKLYSFGLIILLNGLFLIAASDM